MSDDTKNTPQEPSVAPKSPFKSKDKAKVPGEEKAAKKPQKILSAPKPQQKPKPTPATVVEITKAKPKPKPPAKKSKAPLRVVPHVEQTVLKVEDIENLNISKLKDSMIKGVGYIQAALWTQAGFEFTRISHMRNLVSRLEGDILDEKTLKDLTPSEKIKLYGLVTGNMNSSLNFLSQMHGNVTTGLEALSQVEKHKTSQIVPQETSQGTKDLVLDQVKQVIAEKIKEKVGQK